MTVSLRRKGLLVVGTDAAGEGEVRSVPLGDNRLAIEPEFEALQPRPPDELKQRKLADGPTRRA